MLQPAVRYIINHALIPQTCMRPMTVIVDRRPNLTELVHRMCMYAQRHKVHGLPHLITCPFVDNNVLQLVHKHGPLSLKKTRFPLLATVLNLIAWMPLRV